MAKLKWIKYLEEFEDKISENILIEGIDYDFVSKKVYFNTNHENGIDTSININPTYTNIDGYDVISIFKRKKTIDNKDGNPLIYALKNLNGWSIDKKDIILLLKQFIRISGKINTSYDTIISLTSSNVLNTKILHRLNKIINCENKITEHLLSKMETHDVLDNVEFDEIPKDDAKDLMYCISNIDGDYFSFKYIPERFRKYFKSIWKESHSYTNMKYAHKINGKDILILDDTITSGSSISTYCESLLKSFDPKSVTIVTLFSALH
jgi:hypothetical protein